MIARHWGLRHRCKFKWLVDSKTAINRVVFTVSKDYRPTKQPNNVDLLSIIRELHQELRRPLKIQWIKSHQDNDTKYERLSPDAKINIDVDALATEQHNKPRSKPKIATPHIPSTKISITINKIRYASNIEDNLRFHINGGYLRKYLQQKHSWTDSTWDTINLPAMGRFLKTLPLNQHTAHIKFIHDKQPLGNHKLRLAPIKDPAVSICPCCLQTNEDQLHLLQCRDNPARPEALALLIKTLTDKASHPYGICLAASIESFLKDPNTQPSISLTSFLPLYREAITEALLNQEKIGWQNLLRSYFALSWLRLASIRPLDSDKPDNKRGTFRISQSLSALHKYTRSIWLGRNDVLHKTQDKVNATIFTAESKEIRHYFADPLLIPAEDRHYTISQSLEKILRSRPSVRRRWLRRVRTARANMIKNGQSQSTIKHFFSHIPHHDSTITIRPTATALVNNTINHDSTRTAHLSLAQPPPTQNTERTPGRPPDPAIQTGTPKRANTTQQRMTEFFPGRPPEHHQMTMAPGNPPHI
jgi:hypothetical protein